MNKENKLPNPKDFYFEEILKYLPNQLTTTSEEFWEIMRIQIVEGLKTYGRKVRDYTLELASEELRYNNLDMEYDGGKEYILNLKNDKRLEI